MDILSSNGRDLLETLRNHPDYNHLNDPDFFVDYPVMHSPLSLPGMALAVEYLENTLKSRENMLLVGDRDVDGVSSTALLQRFLIQRSGEDQNRVETVVSSDGDDYGLSGEFLQRILSSQAALVILMDMGSAHLDEIRMILESGKNVIVIDHHVISDEMDLPNCAFINPRLLPYRESLEHQGKIATVGLVYKLIIAYALYHTGLWNRIEILRQDDGSYQLYRAGAYLLSSDARGSLVPDSIQACFPGSIQDNLQEARLALDRAFASAAAQLKGASLSAHQQPASLSGLILNGLFSLQELEFVLIHETDLVEKERISQRPWLESEEGRLRAGQYLFALSVMQRPRLLEFMVEHSDLAAIGLVTDMVPLRGENRVVARLGMRLNTLLGSVIPEPEFRPGLGSLYSALRIDRKDWSGRDFGWKIGPVLNAAGRMGETELALKLLCAVDREEASTLARQLVRLNEKRKDRTRKNQAILDEIIQTYPEMGEDPILVCFDERLEPGVSGILASRMMERFRKPVVYMNLDGDRIRGSVRSFGGLSALSILERVSDLLVQYGGHPEAAGFSLERDSVDALSRALVKEMHAILQETGWKGEDHAVRDGVVVDLPLNALNGKLYEQLEQLEPFGPGNPEPFFRISGVAITEVKFLSGGLHAQLTFGTHRSLRGVLWNRGALIHSMILASGGNTEPSGTVSGLNLPVSWISGTLEADAFRGGKKRSRFQFVIQDLHSPLFEAPQEGQRQEETTEPRSGTVVADRLEGSASTPAGQELFASYRNS